MAASAASASSTALILLIVILLSTSSPSKSAAADSGGDDPSPTPWPDQFHAVLFMNYSGTLTLSDLWYDWTNGRNFHISRNQLETSLLYDLEWNNGSSFFYHLDSTRGCLKYQLDVGLLRPNWLDGATYLGQRNANGFLCNVWSKSDFLVYYEDVATKRPVYWVFYTGREAHVMTFEEGAALEDAKWQVPAFCFEEEEGSSADIKDITDRDGESLLHGALRGSISMAL